MAFMNSGLTYARQWNLRPGIAVSNVQMAQLNTALSAYNAYNAASGGDSGSNPDTPTPTAGPTAGFTVGTSYGTSTSHAESQQSSATSTQGQVAAGGNISFKATGAGQDSNLTLRGQNVQAGGKITLAADNQVNLLAAQDTASQQSNNQSSSNAVGATFALGGNQNGLSFQASANKALGNANGDSTTYNNTQVAAKQVQIDSGGDTTLKGAVVKADQVTANVGGNPLGPSVDQLRAQGKTWQEIINSAARPGGGDLSFAPPGFYGGAK